MLRHMRLAEMTAVFGQLVDKTTRRETFLSIPEVAPLHPLQESLADTPRTSADMPRSRLCALAWKSHTKS